MPPLLLNGVDRSTTEEDLIDFVVDGIRQGFLRSGDTFVMDNYAVHRSSTLRGYLNLAGVSLLFLPKYCPELNPIELVWSKIKYSIRRHGKRTLDEAIRSLATAASELTCRDIEGYFRHCGY